MNKHTPPNKIPSIKKPLPPTYHLHWHHNPPLHRCSYHHLQENWSWRQSELLAPDKNVHQGENQEENFRVTDTRPQFEHCCWFCWDLWLLCLKSPTIVFIWLKAANPSRNWISKIQFCIQVPFQLLNDLPVLNTPVKFSFQGPAEYQPAWAMWTAPQKMWVFKCQCFRWRVETHKHQWTKIILLLSFISWETQERKNNIEKATWVKNGNICCVWQRKHD